MLLESASACASRAPEGGGRRADHGQPLTDHFVMQLPQMLFAGAFHAYGDAASPAGHYVSTVRQPPQRQCPFATAAAAAVQHHTLRRWRQRLL